MAQPVGAENRKPGPRQEEEHADNERDCRAREQHLTDRIARHQPFRRRARPREHDGGEDHVEDAERNVFTPRGRSDCVPVRAACFAHGLLWGTLLLAAGKTAGAGCRCDISKTGMAWQ